MASSSVGSGRMEEQLKLLHSVVDETWGKLDQMWKKVGHDLLTIQKRKSIIHKHVKELLTEMVEEEGTRVAEKEATLEALINEIAQLAKDLTLDGSTLNQAREASHGKTLLQIENLYLEIATDLRKRKGIRMDKYYKVNNRVVELSDEMGEEPFTIEFEGIPSDNQVAKLEQHVTHQVKEKQRRHNLFKKLKKSIISLFECEELIPKNEFERFIFSDEDLRPTNCGFKMLSLKVLNDMEELEGNLKKQIQINHDEGERLWQKIRELWSRLTVEDEICMAFEKVHRKLHHLVGDKMGGVYKPSVLRGLQTELNRLEEEKRRNMSLFINQVRDELVQLWTAKCFMNNVDIRFQHPNFCDLTEFQEDDFVSDLYSEELLNKHEKEVEYWRDFVDRNKKIIDGVTRRNDMFTQYKELDLKSDDPSRLANRGGALLKEEKERKRLEKAIPKLENELKQWSNHFEETKDSGFGMKRILICGRMIPNMIEEDWALFHEEKDRRKESRKKDAPAAIGKTMMTTQIFGNAGSRKRPATPSSTQRICINTPVKRNKLAPSTPGRSLAGTPFSQPPSSNSRKFPASTNKLAGQSSLPNKQLLPPRSASNLACTKRYFTNRPPKATTPVLSVAQLQARKILRKSMKGRNGFGSSFISSCASSINSSNNVSVDKVVERSLNPSIINLNFSALATSSQQRKNFVSSFQSSREFNFPPVECPLDINNDTFAKPATRSRNVATVPNKKVIASKIPSRPGKGKEQIDPVVGDGGGIDVVSPVTSYTEFTDHLLCQSTLNSSAVSTITKSRNPLKNVTTAPTNPTKLDGLLFTPAKKANDDDSW